MANDNIRDWGRQNGFEVEDGGRLPSGLRAAFDGRTRDDVETTVDVAPEVTDNAERAPVLARTSAAERVKSLANRARKPAPKTGRLAKARARVSTEKLLSWVWSTAASAASNFNPALGRVLEFQAPVAGMVLEDKVRNSIIDKGLQPFARTFDGGNTAMALIGPPILIQALTMRPERAPQIIPMLRASLRAWVTVAGDKLEAQVSENKEFEDKYGKKVDEMIAYLIEPLGFTFNPPPSMSDSE